MSQQQYDWTENDLGLTRPWLDDSVRLERVYDFDRIIMLGGVPDFYKIANDLNTTLWENLFEWFNFSENRHKKMDCRLIGHKKTC